MSEFVTLSQQTATLKESFNRFDSVLRDIFMKLEDALSRLYEEDLSLNKKFDIVIEAEYIVVAARAKILVELSSIQNVLSSSTTSSGIEKLFKDRYSTIISMCQRINELREDFSVVQRSMWARNNGRL